MKPEVDVGVDYAFKKVFGTEANKPLLMHLLTAVLTEELDQPLATLEIVNPFTGQEALDEKLSILDVLARDQVGRQFNVEMQMVLNRHLLPPRLLYYWAGRLRASLHEGEDYGLLRPTFTICFVNGVLCDSHPDLHHVFRLWATSQPPLLFGPWLSLHVVELPKFLKRAEDLTGTLDLWCYFLKHSAELDTDHLPGSLATPEIQRALEVLMAVSKDEIERQRYLHRRKAQVDALSFQRAAEREAQEARAKGLAEGALIGQIQAYEKVLRAPLTPFDVLATRSIEELRDLLGRLEKQLPLPR